MTTVLTKGAATSSAVAVPVPPDTASPDIVSPNTASPDIASEEAVEVEDVPADNATDDATAGVVKRSRKRPPLLALIGVAGVLAVGGVFGLRWWQYASTHETTDDAQLAGHVYQISSRINGTVQQVPVTDNAEVTAGEVLVQLDSQDYQAKVDQAQAALVAAQQQAKAAQVGIAQAGANAGAQQTSAQGAIASAGAGIADARAGLDTAKSGVPVAQAELDKASATLAQAQTDYGRYQDLFSRGAVSAQDRDAALQTYEVAQAQQSEAQQGVQQAQAQVNQAQASIAKAQSELVTSQGTLQQAQASGLQTQVNSSQYAAAQAQIAQAQASLKEAQLQLSYTQIKAPAAGVVGNKSVEPGTQIQIGQPLMAVVSHDFWVMANFKETQLADIRVGEPVSVEVDALGGPALTGKVESLSPASGSQFSLLPPDNATGNFTKVVQRIPVKIAIDPADLGNSGAMLSPGMSATVSIDVSGAAQP